jgi:hypothetical protein
MADDYVENEMFSHTENPLAKYYRVPGLHVPLPTRGAFMPPGTIELTMKGEVPVYPMRAADEMLLKSPDALMSGYALEQLILSCVPAIKAPRMVSTPDLDVLLLAIRAATYGEVITLMPTCPVCSTVNEVQRNLSYLMSTMTFIEPENPVRLTDEIVMYVRPYNMENATKLALVSFEEARKLQALEQAPSDERSMQVGRSMQQLAKITSDILAECVQRIVVPEGTVSDPQMIKEFMANISKPWTDRVQQKLEEINGRGIDKSYDVTCASCGANWKAEVEFNPSSFFEPSSSV